MGVRFYADSWLTAAAGVGLLRALENAGYEWEGFVRGNTIELEEEIFEKLGYIYSGYILKDLNIDMFEEILSSRKQNFNVYTSIVYRKIGRSDFFSNSPITNPSYTPISKAREEFDRYMDKETDHVKLYKKAKDIVKGVIKNEFEKLLLHPRSDKTCFFCKERKAYKKDGNVKVLDATNFTPLAASLDTVENFFWEGKSNMYLCSECEIFLYFSAFGFHRTPMRTYLFVYMPDLENTKRMNDLLRDETDLRSFMNRTVVEASKILEGRKADWILRNIYIVEIEKVGDAQSNIYTLSISPRLARAIRENIEDYPKAFNDLFGIFLDYVYSSRSLYEFLYKILSGFFFKSRYKNLMKGLDAKLVKKGTSFKDFLPPNLTYFIKFQEVLDMDDKDKISKQINWAYSEGLALKEIYEQSMGKEKASRKIEGISYRLLDAVRRRDTDAFQQNLIRAYLHVGEKIPTVFVEALKDGSFNRIAYAFLIGLNGKPKNAGEAEETLG